MDIFYHKLFEMALAIAAFIFFALSTDCGPIMFIFYMILVSFVFIILFGLILILGVVPA